MRHPAHWFCPPETIPFPHWFSQCARMRHLKELPECDGRMKWNHWSHPRQSSNSCWFWPGNLLSRKYHRASFPSNNHSIYWWLIPCLFRKDRENVLNQIDPAETVKIYFGRRKVLPSYRVLKNLLIEYFHLCMIGDRIFRIWRRSSRWGGAWQDLSFELCLVVLLWLSDSVASHWPSSFDF
jgi:hypothetical protein